MSITKARDTSSPTGAAGGDLTGTYPDPTLGSGVVADDEVATGAAIALAKLANPGANALVGDIDGGTTTGSVAVSTGLDLSSGVLTATGLPAPPPSTAGLTLTSDSVPSAQWKQGTWNVLDFADIDAAIAAATATGGTVYCPAGTHACPTAAIPSGILILGDGDATIFTGQSGVYCFDFLGSIGSAIEGCQIQPGTSGLGAIRTGDKTTVRKIHILGAGGSDLTAITAPGQADISDIFLETINLASGQLGLIVVGSGVRIHGVTVQSCHAVADADMAIFALGAITNSNITGTIIIAAFTTYNWGVFASGSVTDTIIVDNDFSTAISGPISGVTDGGTNLVNDNPIRNLPGDGNWTDVQGGVGFQNSWADVGGSNAPTAFRKDGFGRVDFRVSMNSGASGAVAFTLPAGYTPGATETFTGQAEEAGANALVEFAIDSAGNCTPTFVGALTGNVFITGSFWAGQ